MIAKAKKKSTGSTGGLTPPRSPGFEPDTEQVSPPEPEAAAVADWSRTKRGILCPNCRWPGNQVVYSRLQTDLRIRIRRCIRCGHEWQTEERTRPGETIDRHGRAVRLVQLADFV